MVRDASDGSRYTSSIKPQGSINDLGKCAAHAMPHVGVAVFGCLLLLNLTAAADLLPPSASQNPLVISPANSTLSHTLTNMTSAAAIVVRPATVHTATFIFMHGLGDTGAGWSAISENFRLRRKFDEVAFIFPHAPKIPITCNMGWKMPGWYDIKNFDSLNTQDDEEGMMGSVATVNKIIDDQIEKGIAPERIIVGGFSQGSVIALLTGLTSERPLGGTVALSSYLPLREKLSTITTQTGKEIPIFMAHGKRDPVVKYVWGEKSKDLLVEMGLNVSWKSYNDLEHSATPEEINDMEKWIDERLKATASKVRSSA